MLLGSGELGKEVIIALQRLGVEVIAVDRYANAPGHQVIVGDDVDGRVLLDHFEDPVTQVFYFILAQPHGRLQWCSGMLPIEYVIH